jgi:hypothetical protein
MKRIALPFVITLLVLAACAPSVDISVTEPSFSDQVATVVAGTLQALPPTKTPQPTDRPACSDLAQGMKVLNQDALGYCLLYPQDYIEVVSEPAPVPAQVCLVPGEPSMACHNANAFIIVDAAAGRTAGQIADEMIAGEPRPEVVDRSSLTVAGEEAVLLDGLVGVDLSRQVVLVHEDRIYRLMFVPWDETSDDHERVQVLYQTIIDSFDFVPVAAQSTPMPASQAASPTQTVVSCPNALPTRLQAGGYAYVDPDPPLSNRVRSGPGPDSPVIGDIEPGEAMKILGGPVCAQDRLWWEVQALEGSLTGWTAEGDSQDYWLVPCSSPANCANP